jgi:lactoylglutathione lyase
MKIEHIAMYVNDIEQARAFFMKYLEGKSNDGYHNPKTDFRSYFISFDDGARLELFKSRSRDLARDSGQRQLS